MDYSQTGSYISLAGLVVFVLSRFGITLIPTDAEQIISGLVILWGIIHQAINHRNLAVAAGAIQS